MYDLLTLGEFFIDFARNPNLKDINVSLSFMNEGETLITRLVMEFPPKLSCNSLVSFESL